MFPLDKLPQRVQYVQTEVLAAPLLVNLAEDIFHTTAAAAAALHTIMCKLERTVCGV